MKKILLGAALAATVLLTGCVTTPLTQNVQKHNPTGESKDNRWDYYVNEVEKYTITHAQVAKDGVVVSTTTPNTWAEINVNQSETASINLADSLIIAKEMNERPADANPDWDRFFKTVPNSDLDGTLYVSTKKQVMLGVVTGEDGIKTTYTLYPARYLLCKEIVTARTAAEEALAASLLKTALLIYIEANNSTSYGGYSGTYSGWGTNGSYSGNTWYTDNSWVGERANDALTAIFSGNATTNQYDTAWSELKCF